MNASTTAWRIGMAAPATSSQSAGPFLIRRRGVVSRRRDSHTRPFKQRPMGHPKISYWTPKRVSTT
jgi:hypothetical protein